MHFLLKNKIYLFFLLVLVVGALLRGLEIYTGNYLFLYDQGLYYEDVKRMIIERKPVLIGTYTPIPGIFQAPYFYYLLAIFFVIFRGDPYGGIVFSFLIGMLALLVSFILMKKLFSEKVGLFTAFVFAVSPAAISASRMLWPPYPIHLIMPFYLFSLTKACWGEKKYLPITFFFASLISCFEIPGGIILYLPIIVYILLYQRKFITKKTIFTSFLLGILPLLPLIIFNFRHENISFKGVLGVLQGKFNAGTPQASIIETFFEHLRSFRNNFLGMAPTTDHSWFLVIFLVAGSIIFFWSKNYFSKREKIFIFILSTLPILAFEQFMLYRYVLWGWYLIALHPVYIFLFGFLLAKLFSVKKSRLIAASVVAVIIIKSFLTLHFMYTKEIHDEGGAAKIKGKLEVLDYIYQDARGERFNVLVFMPPVYTYPYDYLFEWYGKKKYGYVPGKEKKGLFYLLIEPDAAKPWTYRGWQETVIKVGKVLKTEKLPSGLIVEKRYYEAKD